MVCNVEVGEGISLLPIDGVFCRLELAKVELDPKELVVPEIAGSNPIAMFSCSRVNFLSLRLIYLLTASSILSSPSRGNLSPAVAVWILGLLISSIGARESPSSFVNIASPGLSLQRNWSIALLRSPMPARCAFVTISRRHSG
jgi:hypothetical protein